MRTISELDFRIRLKERLNEIDNPVIGRIRSVSGPGRSGAIAAVYTSHFLGVPFIPEGYPVPDRLRPHLVIDTAAKSGRTLRRAERERKAELSIALFQEPPRVNFWYETVIGRLSAYTFEEPVNTEQHYEDEFLSRQCKVMDEIYLRDLDEFYADDKANEGYDERRERFR